MKIICLLCGTWYMKYYLFTVWHMVHDWRKVRRIEMMGRRGRRRKQLLDDLKEKRRCCKLKEEALDRTLWRTRFGRGYGPVVRQTAEWMNVNEQNSNETYYTGCSVTGDETDSVPHTHTRMRGRHIRR
jgi:hypothetical protein